MLNYIDILFALGSLGFLIAALKQLWKLTKVTATEGISKSHYMIKLLSLACYSAGYILSGLPMALVVVLCETVLTFMIIYLIIHHRRNAK